MSGLVVRGSRDGHHADVGGIIGRKSTSILNKQRKNTHDDRIEDASMGGVAEHEKAELKGSDGATCTH